MTEAVNDYANIARRLRYLNQRSSAREFGMAEPAAKPCMRPRDGSRAPTGPRVPNGVPMDERRPLHGKVARPTASSAESEEHYMWGIL